MIDVATPAQNIDGMYVNCVEGLHSAFIIPVSMYVCSMDIGIYVLYWTGI